MLQDSLPQALPPVIHVWTALTFAATAFFFLSSNASLKRRLWPTVSIALALLLFGAMSQMALPTDVFVFLVLGVTVLTLLNLRNMRFCSSCGKTNFSQNPFSPPKFCSKCGASCAD